LKFSRLSFGLLGLALLQSATNRPGWAQDSSGISTVKGTLTGSRSEVFNTKNQCELIDIPDAPARAFVTIWEWSIWSVRTM